MAEEPPAGEPIAGAVAGSDGTGGSAASGGRGSEPVAPFAPAAETSRVRWFRRRPPAEFSRFGRGVWWCGHVQLFLALASLPLGVLLILWGVVGASPEYAGGAVFLGTTLVALPGPLAISGLMLRGSARRLEALTGGRRWAALIGWVLLIALIATVAMIAAIFLVVTAFVVVTGMAG